ncbi:hypothetical protein UA08_05598 [Talaromyces atroroseus]|uniref:HNH domain-containing protein n=1 Tax=Talaromyces atroroseus TaxID=1441469 RepID=A0A225AU33_TALAT|nr:hypothetical protein UA08_05598 [Talaromyces atroroseus]OKL59109.1 hypothetical protein UA08_05598 [Talaromyces atroroseus]
METLAAPIPVSVAESLSVYAILPESLDLTAAFLRPVLTDYITSVTSGPPVWASTRTESCEICERDWIPLSYHHLIPREVHAKVLKRGWHDEWQLNSVAWLCRACHSFVHRMASNEELARGSPMGISPSTLPLLRPPLPPSIFNHHNNSQLTASQTPRFASPTQTEWLQHTNTKVEKASSMSSPDTHSYTLPKTQNFFFHIYTTHAHRIIEDYIARNKKERIRRAKIETDIIRLTHENPDLPISHKVIMHTNTFETFWSEQKIAYDLPDKSLARLEPEYSLMDEVACPAQQGDDSGLSAVENFTTKDKEDDAPNAKKPARGANKKKNNNNSSSSSNNTQPRQPLSNKKNAQPQGIKAPRNRAATAAATTKKPQTAAPSKPKPTTSTSTTTTTRKPTGVIKNVSPKAVSSTAAPSPRGPLSAREAYEQCMARNRNEPKLRGPSSDEEDDDDDGSSESEAE